jgi:hypothetical protein
MSNENPTTDVPPAQDTTVDEPPDYEPVEDDGVWIEEPRELPSRPRRRLLTPTSGALMAMLLTAGGFVAGVLVEKGQTSSRSSAGGAGAGAAARFGRLRGSATGSGASGGSSASGGFAGAGGSGATIGQVVFTQGATLYVTNTQGNTVKVTTSPGSTVTKSVKASAKSIHPGETVIVTGTTGADGAIGAESIRVGGSGEGGVPASPFGGSSQSSSGKAGGSEPSLFGNGG